jgi:hypothetical protein
MAQVAVTSEPLDVHALTHEVVRLKPDTTYGVASRARNTAELDARQAVRLIPGSLKASGYR